MDPLRAWLRRRVGARVRLPRSLFAKAVALLVVTLGVVSVASVRVFSGELAASAQGELDARGHALLRALERHEDVRLAAALSDAPRLEAILKDLLGADRAALYLALIGTDGAVIAAASRLDGVDALAGELEAFSKDAVPPSDDRVRRFAEALRATTEDAGLGMPGTAPAPRSPGRLVLSLDATRAARQVARQAVKIVAVTGLVLLAAFLAFFWTISRRASTMVAFAERLAAGDLGARLSDTTGDELGRLAAALDTLRDGLERMVRQLRDGSSELHAAAGEVLRSAEAQVALAARQGTTVQETNAVVLRLRDGVRDAGQQAEGVVARARESADSSRTGATAVGSADAAIRALRDHAETMAGTVAALVERSGRIAEIRAAMREFAEQSHVLSMNASIEAARAGDAGRGFAIVAAEVRRLAERSRGATAEITRIVQDVQRAARESLAVVGESRERAQDAVQLAADSGDAIQRLAAAIGASSEAADRIARATVDQGGAVDQLWKAFQEAFEATREVSSGVEQLREASRAIAGRADHMRTLVERYELPEEGR